jgi:hypothetical protein
MTERELQKILDNHRLWLEGEGGKRANLSCANFSGANLSGVNLSGAYLNHAYLSGADLSCANLSCANLSGANLSGANLGGANLTHAGLPYAYLSGANLSGASLSGANLSGANLSGVVYNERTAFFALQCPEEGAFIGWKKCRDGVIVKLLIPEDAKRSSATSRKCRASKAVVLEVIGAETAISEYDFNCVYEKGKTLVVDCFDDNRWNACSSGIHFFLTRKEAENYKF